MSALVTVTLTVQNLQTGVPLPGATVTVYRTGTTTKASVYDLADAPLSNPMIADSTGLVQFQISAGIVCDVVWSLGSYTSPRYAVGVESASVATILSQTLGAKSSSTLSITTGSKTLEIMSGLAFYVGERVVANYDANTWMAGVVTSYIDTLLTVSIDSTSGSGSYSDWTVGIAGQRGEPGAANTLSIGSVTTLPPGSSATAVITGVSPSQTLNLGLPAGMPYPYTPAAGGSVKVANAAALPSFVYAAGVMTASANGAFPSVDGVSLSVGERFWHWDYTGANGADVAYGIYALTDAGSGGTKWVATRATDTDTAGELGYTSAYVSAGTVNKGLTLAVTQAPGAITLGTTAIIITQVAAPASAAVNIANLEYAQPFMPGALAAFQSVRRLELFGANPAKFYAVKYFFWNDVGTRFNFTLRQCDDVSGTNPVDVVGFSSSGVTYAGLTEFTLAAVGGSGVTGTLVVDLTGLSSITVNSAPASPADYVARAISPKCLFDSTAKTASITGHIQSPIDASLALIPGSKKPFVDACTNLTIRSLITGAWVYGCDPSHQYVVSTIEVSVFPGLFSRARVTIRDITSSTDVCTWSTQSSGPVVFATFLASLPSTIKLTQGSLGSYSGVYAVVSMNWAAMAEATTYTYTTAAQAGLHADLCLSDEQVSDYLDRDFWHEIVRVGAAESYTTLRAAVESLQIDPAGGDFQCNRSHYHHRILVDIVDAGTYSATNLTIPEFVDIRGLGPTQTTITRENTNAYPQFQAHYDTKFIGCTIQSDSNQYCIHSDNINGLAVSGGKRQNRWLRQKLKRVRLLGGTSQDAWLFGCGISSGQEIVFENVEGVHLNTATTTQAAFGFHNTGPTISTPGISASNKPAHVKMIGCRATDPTMYAVHVQSLDPSTVSMLTLIGCDFHCVRNDIASGEVLTDLASARFGWEIGGVHAGPIYQYDPDGAYVLATTAGISVSGTAASLIFGTVDELGRGTKWIKDTTTYSLGARLGDCSSVNKTLTIGAQTCTFTTNLTAASNATVIGLINATCGTNPVSAVDISLETYPDTGFTRFMLNSTGATIPKGRFVTRTGANTIALAGSTDPIFGWVYRDILNGRAGNVVTTRKVHQAYIGNAASSSGKWGITSNGQLDFAAGTKIGDVQGGIVTVW